MGLQILVAQTKDITGKVTSAEDGESLPGVSVAVKGTTLGTITDMNGVFGLRIPQDAKTLVFSFVGMTTQEVEIGNQTTFNVKLASTSISVDEIVVTAMGIKRSEKSLGYSAGRVSSSDLTETGSTSMMNSLQGKIAGVNVSSASGAPGASSRVILRGVSSLGGSNQPLYVVDGIPINNGMVGASTDINEGLDFGNRANDINPNDIQEMTILKGGSGSALYGSRAANGVIIITTKKGAAAANGTAKVEFSNATTFESPLRLPTFQNEFGQGWYDGTLAANLEENGSWGPRFDGKNRIWGHVVDNQQQFKPYVALKDNIRDFFETGLTNNASVSIGNSNDHSSFYLSYGNVNDDGIMPGNSDSYKRNTIALRGSSKFGEKINVSGSMNYIRKDSKFVPTGQEQSTMDALWQMPRDISVVDLKDYKNKFNNVDNYFTVFAQNPYYVLNEHGNRFRDNRMFGNINIDYTILPWMVFTYRAGTDISNATLKSWRAITLSKRATYNDEVGRVSESAYSSTELTSDFNLSMNKKFNDFDLGVVLGQTLNQRENRNQSTEVVGLSLPGFYNLSNSASTPSVAEFSSKRRLVGVFGTVDLAWKQMLFVNFSGRNDWSSTLAANNRSFFYPSGSVSFLFTELMKDHHILSFGKIRAGISQTGNDAGVYLINSIYPQTVLTDGYRNLNFPLAGPINGFSLGNRLGNPDLKSELTSEKEVGADLRFLNSRFMVDFTYYDRTTTDLIWNVTLPASTGFTSQTRNLGKVTNKGIELMLTVVPVKTKDLEWKLTWNYAKNNNKLVSLIPGLDQIDLGYGTSSVGYVARPGMPLGLFEGVVAQTTPDGKPVVNSNGLPLSSPARQILGSSQYKYTMGGTSSLTWKGVTLFASLDVRQGGLMYSRTSEMMYFTGNGIQTTYNDRQPWIIPNSVQNIGTTDAPEYVENTTPIAGGDANLNLFYNQTYSAGKFGSLNLIDRSFVKLRELSLSYSLPKKFIVNTPITGVDISLIGRNLLLWTPNSNTFTDPESTTFGDEAGLGAGWGEYGATPTTRSYGFSVRLTF
ncbi:MAG TPA: SusC/RagA family TonB-linked outer membrane protein [Prolixibacteraceae bacterium]|nr:SusC/RagA family TonB-linked outer membrane protein [Prolixibacteraceae bacterium]